MLNTIFKVYYVSHIYSTRIVNLSIRKFFKNGLVSTINIVELEGMRLRFEYVFHFSFFGLESKIRTSVLPEVLYEVLPKREFVNQKQPN